MTQRGGPGRARRFCSDKCKVEDRNERHYEKTGYSWKKTCRHMPRGEGLCAECKLKDAVRAWLKNHGLTIEEGVRLLASQGGGCAICHVPIWWGRTDGDANIDHDHDCCPRTTTKGGSCGKCVRGMLCARCNQGLGHFGDSTDRVVDAAVYLERYARKV